MSSHFPHFIEDKLVHSCNLNISRKLRSKLALVRSLQFYEVYKKQILSFIDLQDTILSKIQYKFDSLELKANETISQTSDIFASSRTCPTHIIGGIIFGKFIYQSRSDSTVYILIKCWNLMVVIKKNTEGFILQAEYEDVRSFQVSKESNYQCQVTISFLNNNCNEITNFQDRNESLLSVDLPTTDGYRKIMDRIKIQQSELLVHQTITRKEFAKLKNVELFGCNILRTPRLEEMQILSKCGNSWIKITANDDVVIGIPIVNNCSSRMTILRSFRVVLQGTGDLTYAFKMYQLNKSFCDLESIEDFFNDSESEEKNYTDCSWKECVDFSLRPEAFTILVLKLKLNELFFECGIVEIPLFAFYDICTSNRTFNQKCFITKLSLRDIFTNKLCRIKFDEKNLHRDLLTVMASSYKTEIRLEYVVSGAAFEDFLCTQLGFYKISKNPSFSESMNVDGHENDVECSMKEKLIFYNKNQDSVWHGTLLEISDISKSSADLRIFTKSHEKSKVLLKHLQFDLKACLGIKNMQENMTTLSMKLIEFEAALRDECLSCLETYSNSAMKKGPEEIIFKKTQLHNHLHLKQLKTDLLFKDLFS